jgi:hypothetical protein
MADEARIAALEQQLQALQTQLTAATVQAAQPAAPPVAQPPIVQPGPFALTPALANQNVIDLLSSPGIKLYKTITTPLANKFEL